MPYVNIIELYKFERLNNHHKQNLVITYKTYKKNNILILSLSSVNQIF